MKKEIIIKILNELDKNNKLLGENDLELGLEQYGQVIQIMSSTGLISGVTVDRVGLGGKYQLISNKPMITLSGIEYLENNKEENSLVKAIDRLTEQIRDLKYSITSNK